VKPRHPNTGACNPAREQRWLCQDRRDAGEQLAEELLTYRGKGALVLGMARGGIPVARAVAERLSAQFDVIVARKLGAPGQEELAIGAIAADGTCCLNRQLILQLGLPDASVERLAAEQCAEAKRLEQRLRRGCAPLDAEGRVVILVDDGLATGATLCAAIRSLRRQRVRKLVVAVPVGAADGCELIAEYADEVVCPHQPEPFRAVGTYYRDFEQTSDEEAARILNAYHLGLKPVDASLTRV
jgi:putative phosphoribosyl transferase